MAIEGSFKYISTSVMTIDLMVHSEKRHPLPTLQQKPNRTPLQRHKKQKGPTTSMPSANRLSRETLCQYHNTITVPLPLSKGGCHLEVLPQDLIDRISQYVPYENLIYLSWVSKRLNKMVDPQLAPYETKLSFVLRAERDFYRHYTSNANKPPNLGCYMCHKVLPAGVFAFNQPLQAGVYGSMLDEPVVVNLRRFCLMCGIQMGLHKSGDEIITRTGERYWICKCKFILSEKTTSCRSCGMPSYLRPRKAELETYMSPTMGYWA
ncbi:hypothetical protein F5Y11DRAFT_324281 [Daldinia sp. FL1419]|nr:hypothetical protein F5Y11DRAFT_324281 [Daldinia sp. FL1419]